MIVRELVGGLYFGARGVRDDGTVFDTLEYHPAQIERVVRRGVRARRRAVAAHSSRSTRRTCSTRRACGVGSSTRSRPEYPDVELRHALVDSFAMELVTQPDTHSTCMVTENTFGDILSDVAAAVTGGLGLAASASLGDAGPGIFEPVHGSAPDIAGTGRREPGRDAALTRVDARARASAGAISPARLRCRRTTRSARTRRPTSADAQRRASSATPCSRRWTNDLPASRSERREPDRRLSRPGRQPQRRRCDARSRPERTRVGRAVRASPP